MNEHNPPACSKCKLPSSHLQGHQWLCPKHYRFGQMRATAKRRGKFVPSYDELEMLAIVTGLECQDCHRTMNWLQKDGSDTVVSLQHYRNGDITFVCLSCNTRHAYMKDDSYRKMPKDHKMCPTCKNIKPYKEYSIDNGRSGPIKRKSRCKSCVNIKHKAIIAERSKEVKNDPK